MNYALQPEIHEHCVLYEQILGKETINQFILLYFHGSGQHNFVLIPLIFLCLHVKNKQTKEVQMIYKNTMTLDQL